MTKRHKAPTELDGVWKAVVTALASGFLLRWQVPASVGVLMVAVSSLLLTQEAALQVTTESIPAASTTILSAAAPVSPPTVTTPTVLQSVAEHGDEPGPELEAAVSVDEIAGLLNSWTTGWQQKDIDAYFAAYAETFEPANDKNRAQWQTERTRNISRVRDITISWHDLTWTHEPGVEVTAEIRLDYQAAGYGDSTQKRLVLRRENGRLRIVGEQNLKIERR